MLDYQNIFLALAVSLMVSIVSMPIIIMIARKIGAVDVPKDDRRMHTRPVPRIGGAAMVYGFMVSMLCFGMMTKQMQAMLGGALLISILGFIDDVRPLSAKLKFLVQIGAAAIVVFYGEITVNFFTIPVYGMVRMNEIVAQIVTVVWIVGVTNAVNLIDGLDGLAAGISTIASFSMMVIALLVGDPVIAVITAALVGCCAGFLPFNMNPARIFMGDTGSTFLGFILAVVSIQGLFKGYAIISFIIPFLVLGLPIFDTGFAIIRRVINKQPIMQADRGHLHHRLIDMGFSQKQTVAILYAISSLLGLSAIIMTSRGALRGVMLIGAVVAALIVGAYFISKPDKVDMTPKNLENQDQDDENRDVTKPEKEEGEEHEKA